MGNTRSITITIVNSTELALTLSQDRLNDGNWVINPPGVITPGETTRPFEATAGFQENGVDGSVFYGSQIGLITFIFNNPNSGLNTFSGTAENPNYKISH
ncbi:hypothetical protein FMEXI_1436 [Fusarium mexicanum]|uniref:Uncharacterized protein n=1 Tax=Fusarium mexicanum TaxID=751941 RepID=A0A8H5JHY7_9HYPO|nr:hypothetical protein FMEXI_1436 [Fusarium mexicanum]